MFRACNRFISVHALGFTFYNILHCTNWVINGMGERFPKLPVIWIEAGLAWVPFLMQRLDHEYMMRSSEAPAAEEEAVRLHARHVLLVAADGDPGHARRWRCTFRMINAETQLLYSSDYPHWDFDLPQTIYDLPFLSEKAKHNILGGTAARLFKLPPRNDKQKAEPDRSSAISQPERPRESATACYSWSDPAPHVRNRHLRAGAGDGNIRLAHARIRTPANPSSAVHPLPHNLIASLPRLVCQGDGCAGQAL